MCMLVVTVIAVKGGFKEHFFTNLFIYLFYLMK